MVIYSCRGDSYIITYMMVMPNTTVSAHSWMAQRCVANVEVTLFEQDICYGKFPVSCHFLPLKISKQYNRPNARKQSIHNTTGNIKQLKRYV